MIMTAEPRADKRPELWTVAVPIQPPTQFMTVAILFSTIRSKSLSEKMSNTRKTDRFFNDDELKNIQVNHP